MSSREKRTLLTLEERLALAAGSQAVSPETAARLVKRLSEVHTVNLFCGKANLEAMAELTGEFLECMGDELLHYGGFCLSFKMAIENDNDVFGWLHPSMPEYTDSSPCRPVFGARVNNAVVLLGELLLEHAKGGMRDKDIYHNTRMTLGQYMDALADLSFREDGTQDLTRAEGFRIWGKSLLKDYDGSRPLGEAMADMLERYIAAWQEFDHIDYVLRCMGALACYLLENGTGEGAWEPETGAIRRFREALCQYGPDLEGKELVDPDKRYPDAYGYYFTLANEYPDQVPDLHSPDLRPGTLRSQIFLPQRDYSPETLRALAAKSPFPDLRALLEKSISKEHLAWAMTELNRAMADLYMLWVEPYLRMEEYHYERHLG